MDLKYKEQLSVYQSGEAWSHPLGHPIGVYLSYIFKQGVEMEIKRTTT